ncbi:MAG: aldehyde ferredoxin oxidoreductase family protein [Candidatus Hodarchaeota archaeon]
MINVFGVWNKVLIIDLTTLSSQVLTLNENDYLNFLGGYGLGVKVLFEHMSPNIDPLGPENVLGFFPGFLTGTGFPMTGRWMAVSKSPLTGLWNDSNCGGQCGPEMKKTGFDGFLIKGQSKNPIYITILDDQVEFHDALSLWGKTTNKTHRILKKRYPRGKPLYIGPAGENLVRYACIIDDRFRAAGRGGLGAVMGSKKLKAIIFRGSRKIAIARPQKFRDLSKKYRLFLKKKPSWIDRQPTKLLGAFVPLLRRIRFHFKPSLVIRSEMLIHMHKTYGTCVATHLSTQMGDAPIKNWKGIGFIDFPPEKSKKISDDSVIRYKTKSYGCRNCYLHCGGEAKVKKGKWKDLDLSKAEYESAAAFGGMCLIDDIEFILKVNSLCDRLGLDAISTGGVIAFIMECQEKKIVSNQINGLDWGKPDAVFDLVKLIGYRQGIGDFLAEGVARMAEKLGPSSTPLAIHVHNQELPMHDPKYDPSYGVTYLTDATPGRHTQNAVLLSHHPDVKRYYKSLKWKIKDHYDYYSLGTVQALVTPYLQVANALGFCFFAVVTGNFPSFSDVITSVIGSKYSLDHVFKTGERILTLRHLFNLREGAFPEDFKFPNRVKGIPPHSIGPLQGVTLEPEVMKQAYFSTLNWDMETGLPSRPKLDQLALTKLWDSQFNKITEELEETRVILDLQEAEESI